MKLEEIRRLNGELLGYALPPYMNSLTEILNNETIKSLKSINKLTEQWQKYLIPMKSLGGEKLGYMLSPECKKFQSALERLEPIFSKQNPLGNIADLVKINSLGGKSLGYLFPPEIEKVKSIAKQLESYFPNRDLTCSLDNLLEEPINKPLNEQEQNVINELIQGKEPSIPLDKINNKNFWEIINKIVLLYEFLSLIIQALDVIIPLQHLYETFTSPRPAIEQILSICDKYPTNGRSYGARIIQSKNGLNLRKYDHQKSEILAKLPDGKFLCVLKEPLDNAQWLLVSTELDNGEVIKGYVARKFTRQLN